MIRPSTRIASFDVFDTVLVRRVSVPSTLFDEIVSGSKLSGNADVGREFARRRKEAEAAASAETGGNPTLAEIYRVLQAATGLSDSERESLLRAEIEVESQSIFANPVAMKLIQDERRRGAHVVFVSDMYLPKNDIAQMLRKAGAMLETDELFVSADQGKTKASGELFDVVLEHCGVRAGSVVHYGDNLHSDVLMPSKKGIKAVHVADALLNGLEAAMGRGGDVELLSSILAGVSRRVRLGGPHDTRQRILWDTGASGVAPVLTLYTEWVLETAKRLGLQRLYFVARDGYLLYRIAKVLEGKRKYGLDLRYLYGSREAWHLAAINDHWDESPSWMLDRASGLTLARALERVGVSVEQIRGECEGAQPGEWWHQPIDDESLSVLKSILLRRNVQEHILEAAHRRRASVEGYLKQEGLEDGERCAVVDLGWHARLQASLKRLLTPLAGERLQGLYCGLQAIHEDAGECDAFLFNPRDLRVLSSYPFLPQVMEMFGTAPHGSTKGYERVDGIVRPILGDSSRLQSWGIQTVHSAVDEFARAYAECGRREWDPDACKTVVGNIVEHWWKYLDYGQAAVWGEFPFSDCQIGKTVRPVGVPYSVSEIATIATGIGGTDSRDHLVWERASLAMTSRAGRALWKCASAIRRVRLAVRWRLGWR
ncbi:hypothetical protein Pan44_38970 [Caulifigura coniformis]|uniref:Uncharacterized protein n=1 Tax=Caulifigura coniformis TaxID=2527983 RepID=A0A517SI98_9PLAN|nr:hypothetical protein Pan44_38970 [Caulifigura coniformis]